VFHLNTEWRLKKRATDSLPSFTASMPEKLSGRTGYDEELDSDTY
jgi:hypothetical protein